MNSIISFEIYDFLTKNIPKPNILTSLNKNIFILAIITIIAYIVLSILIKINAYPEIINITISLFILTFFGYILFVFYINPKNTYKNQLYETMDNIKIITNKNKYPLSLLPNEIFTSNTNKFIIDGEIVSISQGNISYVEVKNKEDEYIVLNKSSLYYKETPYVSIESFNKFSKKLENIYPDYFYEIKEIGYVNILK